MRFVLVCFVLLVTFCSRSFAQTFEQQLIDPNEHLTGIQMLTANVGFAGGAGGVYKTINGGDSWQLLPDFIETGDLSHDVFFLGFNHVNVHFFNEFEGIAYGWHVFNTEMVMKTTDGGSSWIITHMETPSSPNFNLYTLNSLYAWDDDHLVIVGNASRVLRSSDGGDTWTAVQVSAEEIDLHHVQFVSTSRGYIAGDDRFFTSIDGGEHWTSQQLTISDFHFFDALNGVGIAGEHFVTTSDGGSTWDPALMKATETLSCLAFVSNTTGYAAGDAGTIFRTTDGGETWLGIYSDAYSIRALSLLTADAIWFVTSMGYVLHSASGTETTSLQPSFTSASRTSGKIGDAMIINGTNLKSVVGVKFNGQSSSFSLSGASIATQVPRSATTGKIELVWPGGSVFSGADFTVSQAPILYQPSPNFTPVGSTVVIQGENLQHVTNVTVKGIAQSFSTPNSREISFDIPYDYPLYPGPVLNVTSAFGTASITLQLSNKPRITFLNHGQLNSASWREFVITGSNLALVSEVRVGTLAAPAFTVVSDTEIKCVLPPVVAKTTAPITVVAPQGSSISPQEITIYPYPEIISINPLSAKVGETITVTGNFLPVGLGRIWAGGVEVSPSSIRFHDEHTLEFKLPSIVGGASVAVKVENEVGLSATEMFAITTTGELQDEIESVTPIRSPVGRVVVVKGKFSLVDSLTVGGVKQDILNRFTNYVSFVTNANTPSGVVTLFNHGESLSFQEEFTLTSDGSSVPTFSFSPQIASPETRVYINGGFLADNIRFIKSVSVNGRDVPFQPTFALGSVYNVFFTVTGDVTSGPVTITTIDGSYTAGTLTVKPTAQLRPIIYRADALSGETGYLARLYGDHFSNVTNVRLDEFAADFVVLHDDTIMVKTPANTSSLAVNTSAVIVESPNGQASLDFYATSVPTQTILSVTPTTAQRGSLLTVTLEPKKPYINYGSLYHFFLGNTIVEKHQKVDDNTYLIEVPANGNVEGKVGVTAGGFRFASNIDFHLGANGYCGSAGTVDHFAYTRLTLLGTRQPEETTPYANRTGNPIEVIPGQPFRLDVTPNSWGPSRVFFDWNSNEEFDEPGTLMIDPNQLQPADTSIHAIFTVPTSLMPGAVVRLRVVSGPDPTYLLPCGLVVGGQVADYQLNVVAPSNTLKVVDFYPSVGTSGTFVTVVGDNLNDVISVKLNGEPVGLIHQNDHTLGISIWPTSTSGLLEFSTATETITTARGFRIDPAIEEPDPTLGQPWDPSWNLKHVYKATFNGNMVPFYSRFNAGLGRVEIVPIMEFPENGTLCINTPAPSLNYCYNETFHFPSHIDFPDPFLATENQTVTLTGRNLSEITKIELDGNEELSFTLVDDHSITLVMPESENQARTMTVYDPYQIVQKEVGYYSPLPTPCDIYAGWREGVEIVDVQFNQIKNSSLKNNTGGRSDYSALVAIVDQYNSYYTDIKVKNFTNSTQYVSLAVFANGTSTLPADFSSQVIGASEGISLDPYEEQWLHPYFNISENLPLNQSTGIWFALTYYASYEACQSVIGEIEQYSLIVKRNPVTTSLQISSLDPISVRVGEEVNVHGVDLDQVRSLQIGNVFVPFDVVSPNLITFTVPTNASSAKVKVTTLSNDGYSPEEIQVIQPHVINSLNPRFGKVGNFISVNGSNLSQVKSISFDDVPLSNFLLLNNNSIRLKVPADAKTGPLRFRNELGDEVASETFYFCDNVNFNEYCKGDQTITFGALAPRVYGENPFSLLATASSSLPVSFTSSDPTIANISGTTLTILKAGTVQITASQPGSSIFNAAPSVVRQLFIDKASQTIAFNALPPRTIGEAFSLVATASSGLPIFYGSTNTALVTLSGDLVTPVGAGTATITASQPGNENYLAASAVQQSLTVTKKGQVITFNALGDRTYGDVSFNLSATSSSGLPVTFASSNSSIVSLSGATASVLKAGSVEITASQEGNAEFADATPVVQILMIAKKNQSIQFNAIQNQIIGQVIALNATTSSGLPLAYVSSDPAVATIANGTVTCVGVGVVTITASQNGSDDFLAAVSTEQTFTVVKKNQAITLAAIPSKKFGDEAFDINATSDSELPVILVSSDPSILSITGNRASIWGVGSVEITASQPGNSVFAAASPVTQAVRVNKGEQVITFDPLSDKVISDFSFELAATASSGLSVAYSSSNTSIAVIEGSKLKLAGTGEVTITASQPGNSHYNAATPVARTFKVNKETQTITFPVLPQKIFGDSPFDLSATSSSGLPVSYSSSDPAVASIDGNRITLLKAGIVEVVASQSGNSKYESALSVSQVLTIRKAPQQITFEPIVPAETFLLVATATSGLPVNFTSSAPDIATLSGATVTVIGTGRVDLYADQSGDENYEPAVQVKQSFVAVVTELGKVNEGIRVYPNPASSQITIAIDGVAEKTISILAMDGRVLEVLRTRQSKIAVNVEGLPRGIYAVNIVIDQRVIVQRFTKN